MSNASTTQKSHPVRRKIALLTALGLGVVAAPFALAAPAQAAGTSYACSVTPLAPVFAGHNSSGVKLVDYRMRVYCNTDRYINITQQRWEQDDWPNGDDHLGTSTFSRHLNQYSGAVTISNVRTLVDGEIGNEELYQKVSFQEGSNGVWSPYTGWYYSGVTSMSN
ncbi:hypothetical protein [Arthrobacter sp. ISL-72]|uniref:hypothetical protein n=1 Tax=Arthrobacter sp. ISL-72 TaxID=2819114 RepID=UPI001BE685FF|nr:hypothetical protein [Arthrobacter sp. ISL-72]MBT2596293.1 hypothetical protein [Arthrobacter sp. ISL-72]